jgi:putative photosynthetic complex assembly protein 2
MTAGLLLSLGAVTANPTGAYTFALLLIFRLSSKLNIYWGVPNMSDELLPLHLAYLKSYFGPKRLTPMLLASTAVIAGLGVTFALAAAAATQANEAVQASLLCCLCLLAALEHIFLAIPFRDSALWGWAMEAKKNR